MDFFSQNEASQLVKTALNAGAIKLNGVRSNATECESSAKIDAAYMLELYRTLLGPDGAAGAVAATEQTLQEAASSAPGASQPQPQQATQGQPTMAQQQDNPGQQQQGRTQRQNQGQQQDAQGQQNAGQSAQQAAQAQPQASAALGAGAGGAPDFQTFIPAQFRDAAAQGASQGTTQPAAQMQAATAQAAAGGQQAAQPGAAPPGVPGGAPGGQPDFRKFIPEAFRGSVPETPGQ